MNQFKRTDSNEATRTNHQRKQTDHNEQTQTNQTLRVNLNEPGTRVEH